MARVAVAGSTGAIGRLITAHLRDTGYTPVELSRSTGVDLSSGAGLEGKLSDAAAVIDVSAVASPSDPSPTGPIVQAARGLLAAMRDQGCKRYVMLSIFGVQDEELRGYPFYEARFQQERVTLSARGEYGVDGVVVRSPQWYEFVLNPAAATQKWDHVGNLNVEVQDWQIQPAAMQSVAEFLVETALDKTTPESHGSILTVAGRETMSLCDMTAKYMAVKGLSGQLQRISPVMPALGEGRLCPGKDAILLEPDFDQWLEGVKPDA